MIFCQNCSHLLWVSARARKLRTICAPSGVQRIPGPMFIYFFVGVCMQVWSKMGTGAPMILSPSSAGGESARSQECFLPPLMCRGYWSSQGKGRATGSLALLSQLAAGIGVSTAKKRKNASPVKGRARKSQRSEDQVAFHLA